MLSDILIFTVAPILVMIAFERLFVLGLARVARGREWVRSQRWLHPNFIGRSRYASGLLGCLIWRMGEISGGGEPGNAWQHAAIYWFAFWTITDLTDGTIARKFDLRTPEGESIDPLSDKLMVLPPLIYLAVFGLLNPYLVGALIAFDAIGQLSRRFVRNKAASVFGKTKTFLAIITLALIAIEQIYYPAGPTLPAAWTLTLAVAFGFLSLASKWLSPIQEFTS